MRRTIVSLTIGLFSGLCCYWLLTRFNTRAGDFTWAYGAALDLLNGRDPYRLPVGPDWIPYPLPTALVALPFAVFPMAIAAGVFIGVSGFLMALGLTRDGYIKLMAFLSCPFWVAVLWAQWSPLVVASAFFPALMFVTVVKPQVALPVAAIYWSKVGIIAASILLCVSLFADPRWPFKWLGQIGQFQGYIPLLTIPGPALLLGLTRWRQRDARLLLVAAIFPQRYIYDALILWLIPKTRKEFLYTAAISWVAYLWRLYHWPTSTQEVGVMSVLCFYLPMLGVILLRSRAVNAHVLETPAVASVK